MLCPPPGDLPNPAIEPRSPTLQAVSLLSEPSGKPKNTRVGSLSFLWGIFLTQKLNQGLLHCRQILYHLSYPGSPNYPFSQGIKDTSSEYSKLLLPKQVPLFKSNISFCFPSWNLHSVSVPRCSLLQNGCSNISDHLRGS